MKTYEDIHIQNEEYRAAASSILQDYESDCAFSSIQLLRANPSPTSSDFDTTKDLFSDDYIPF